MKRRSHPRSRYNPSLIACIPRSALFSITILTDYSHVPVIGDRLKSGSLARHLAAIPPRTRQIHVVQDDQGSVRLEPLNANFAITHRCARSSVARSMRDAR